MTLVPHIVRSGSVVCGGGCGLVAVVRAWHADAVDRGHSSSLGGGGVARTVACLFHDEGPWQHCGRGLGMTAPSHGGRRRCPAVPPPPPPRCFCPRDPRSSPLSLPLSLSVSRARALCLPLSLARARSLSLSLSLPPSLSLSLSLSRSARPEAGDVWARVLSRLLGLGNSTAGAVRPWNELSAEERKRSTAVVTLGGGHYMPGTCDVASGSGGALYLGHMLASYSLGKEGDPWREAVAAALASTRRAYPGVGRLVAYVNKKSFKASHRDQLLWFLEEEGVEWTYSKKEVMALAGTP